MKKIESYLFVDDGNIPNNAELLLVLYQEAINPEDRDPSTLQRLLRGNGWTGSWVDGIYNYHHYHSTAHEVLVVSRGNARVRFGGPGEEGREFEIHGGDAVVLPAGVGHCLLNRSADFQVVGAYPEGQSWDLCTGKEDERPRVLENIRSVELPSTDPVTGSRNPLLSLWSD